MKKLLFLLLPFAFILAGCKYDDSKVWEELNAQKAQIASLESLNSNVSSLQSIVSALQKNITVTAIKATDQGHSVSFSDGTTVTILSAEAATPKLGAKQDVDGNYYWTVGGNWLLDDSGKKVSTGRTPKIKIEDNLWFISYDDGSSWSKVDGQASSICVFESVATDADNAIFTLSDGSVITIPLANAANKLQLVFNEKVFEKMRNGEVLSTSYKILAPEGVKTDLETYESNGWTVTIYPTDEKTGRISIKAPSTVTPTKVMFILTDDNGGSFVKIVKIDLNEEAKPEVKTDYIVDPDGGELIIPLSSCTAELSEEAEGWAEVVEVGDQVILNIQSNESYDYRICTVTLEDGTVVSLRQITRDALILSSDVVEIDGRRQKVAFVVSTNIRVTATVTEGSDWLSVTPTTKGLTDKVFTLIATRNTTEAERTATVVFSGNDLSETCTVVQAVYDGPSTIDVTEAAATEEGDDVPLAPSKVMALTTDGYVVSDGQSALFVSDGSNSPALGDSVSLSAVAGSFNGITSLEGVEDFKITATDGRVVYPNPTDITGSLDTYDVGTATYVRVTGDLVVNNGTYNLTVSGTSSKVILYKPSYVVGLEALDGHNVTVDGYYYGKSGNTVYIIATKKQDNGSSSMTISQVIALEDNTPFEVKEATVVAKATVGIVVSDETSAIYLYHGSKVDVSASVGDVVSIKGTKTTYNGVPEITVSSTSDVSVQSSGNPVNHPEVKDINSTLDSYSASTAEYITFTGDLVKSGNYYNVIVTGASSRQGSITYPINTSGFYISDKKIEDLSGHNVTVKGYFNGLTSQGKYVTIILTSIVDNGSSQGGGDTPGGDTPGGDDIQPGDGSELSWELGSNAYTQNALVNGSEKTVLKLGTSSKNGTATITVPAGTQSIGFYAVSWKGNVATLVFRDEGGSEVFSCSPDANDGATGNPTYTIDVSSSDYYPFSFDSALSSSMTLTVATEGNKYRVILFDITAN
jgi:hypothetical protein